jgi:hypothetical protein
LVEPAEIAGGRGIATRGRRKRAASQLGGRNTKKAHTTNQGTNGNKGKTKAKSSNRGGEATQKGPEPKARKKAAKRQKGAKSLKTEYKAKLIKPTEIAE